jgi:hypothetical protein
MHVCLCGIRITIIAADENVIELMLRQAVVDSCPIYERALFFELTRYSHFLAKPAMRSHKCVLTRAWMSAACVRPETTAVILAVSAPVYENVSVIVADEDRECAMKLRAAMRVELLRRSNGMILLVD